MTCAKATGAARPTLIPHGHRTCQCVVTLKHSFLGCSDEDREEPGHAWPGQPEPPLRGERDPAGARPLRCLCWVGAATGGEGGRDPAGRHSHTAPGLVCVSVTSLSAGAG